MTTPSVPDGGAPTPSAGVRRSPDHPPGDRRAHRVLEVWWQGCALLAAIQLPGATLDYFIRNDIGPPEILIGVVLFLAAMALMVHRVTSGTWLTRFRPLGASAVAFALAATLAQLAPLMMSQAFVEASDVGILVPAPGRRFTDCRGSPSRCHEHVLNELGFRGRLARRTTPDARLVAFVGDSHIFGSGVGDEDTIPAAVARELSDLRPPALVVNAGVEGLAGGSFPGVIRYLRERLRPDVIVVLLKDDDLDDTDMISRWDQFRRSFWSRVLHVVNVEPVFETARQVRRGVFDQRGRHEMLARQLRAIAAATSGTKLLLMVYLRDDLRPVFNEWIAAHPDIVYASSWDDPRFWRAERIPHDGHWNEAGCREIAAIVVPVLRAQLSGSSPPK